MPAPKKLIKLLLVDDSEDDRELILMNLRRGGYSPDVKSVDTKEGFEEALDNGEWDLIICDYNMPGFDGLAALGILKERARDIPFILVSGAIGEELAVKAMKAGANDYMMKDNLQRLVPAIERELKEAKLREKHREAQIERDRLLTVIQNSLNEIYIFDCETLKFQYLNQAASSNLGFDPDTVQDMTPIDINPYLDSAEDYKRIIQPLLNGELEKDLYLTKHVRKDGSTYPIEIHLQLIRQNDQQFFTAIGFDLTDREKDARRIQEQKEIAKELAEHSKHKSEFLANMSHELRTPLNSILLLSKLLLKPDSNTFTENQQKYINVIQQSGKNLLSLINEILDLSKIESGEMELSLEQADLKDLVAGISDLFEPIATEKGLDFSISIYDNCPSNIVTDQLRLEQVLRNLLSNAMKFTEKGRVDLDVLVIADEGATDKQIIFAVRDTGIGIPENKQKLVFESFRQADGSTQRKYGGTGLGLSICRQIAELLGGTLTLKSSEETGSTFTLTLPLMEAGENADVTDSETDPHRKSAAAADEYVSIPDVLLISENRTLANDLKNKIHTLSRSLKVMTGAAAVSAVAEQTLPVTIFIDPYTSDLSGWSLAKRILAGSSQPPSLWMATDAEHPMPAVEMPGLSGKVSLPLDVTQIKNILSSPPPAAEPSAGKSTLLLIDDNKIHNEALRDFAEDIVDECLVAPTAAEAFKILKTASVDCIVLDLTLPDASGGEVLKNLADNPETAGIPVIIYSGRSLRIDQREELLNHASDVILKNVGSHRKLIHRISSLIAIRNKDGHRSETKSKHLQKSVLVVDDDNQSYFSMSSLLQSEGLVVHRAVNGKEALQTLDARQDEIGVVLLDLMMPDMDGFETIKRIRHDLNLMSLPVFIVTAKAMKGDREECLKHGATDYISKPISPEKLEELMSIWMT